MVIEAFPGTAEATSPEEIGVIKHILLEQFAQVEPQLPLVLVYDQSNDHTQEYLGRKPILPIALVEVVHDDRPLDLEGKPTISPESILEAVAGNFAVSASELVGYSRNRQLTQPRKVGMFLMRGMTRLSSADIGGKFGGRDHSTVLYSVRKIKEALGDPAQQSLAEQIDKIKADIENTDQILSESKTNHINGNPPPRLIFLSSLGLVECPWIDIGDRYKLLVSEDEKALDWRQARQNDGLYHSYANDALKLMRSRAYSK